MCKYGPNHTKPIERFYLQISLTYILLSVTDNCHLEKTEGERKYVARPDIEPRTPDL